MEKSEESEGARVADLQQSFVFGNTSVKQESLHITEDEEPTESSSVEMLDLRNNSLKHITDSILRHRNLKRLYLKGNQLTSVPGSLFTCLPRLEWLDLRDNQIEALPAEIGLHRCLKTLLLEGNPISELPAELGNVTTLTGLNLRDCPLAVPPQEVVREGYTSILQYLRSVLSKRPVSEPESSPDAEDVPVVEKLQLSELTESSADEQESVDEDELQKFKELRQKMVEVEKAELVKMEQGHRKAGPPPSVRRSKKATGDGLVERRQAVMREPKERETEQRRRFQEVPPKPQQKKQTKQSKHQVNTDVTSAVAVGDGPPQIQGPRPPITELEEDRCGVHSDVLPPSENIRRTQTLLVPLMEMMAAPEKEPQSRLEVQILAQGFIGSAKLAQRLERQFCAHVESLQERRRNPQGMSSELRAADELDLQEMRRLQAQLLERRQTGGGLWGRASSSSHQKTCTVTSKTAR